MSPPKVKDIYSELLNVVFGFLFNSGIFDLTYFKGGADTASNSVGRQLDKTTRGIPGRIRKKFRDNPMVLSVDGFVAFKGSRLLGESDNAELEFGKNAKSAELGFVATQGPNFLFCGCSKVDAEESEVAETLAIWNAVLTTIKLKSNY